NDFAREQTQLHLQGKFDRHAVYLEIIHANGDKILLEGFENPIIRDNKVVGLHGIARDITEQKKSELLLKQSEEKFKAAFITSPDSININRMSDGRYISINKGFTRIMGYTEEEIIGKSSLELNIWVHAEEREKFVAVLQKNGKVENFESQFRAKDGTLRTGLMSASILQLDNEPHIISITRDITEINRLQEELTQSQKMLSIGTLAGGIAHDFNNILNIILGYTAMLEKRKSDGQKFSESISAITQAVDRGSALVRQILTFARKTEVEFKPLYMPDIIRELFSMLKQTFPKIFTFHEEMETSLPFILGDQTQLHQVFLNLCVNARDAMPHGGSITIHIRTVQGIQIQERFSGADQNRYMCISVEDTGLGMDDATRQRIFDPFFTTKGAGKGTGLGLAVVYGIIQAHHGFIDVHSMLGSGTRFDIYLPIAGHEQQLPRSSPEKSAEELRGSEMILIVEDEDFLLEVLRNILESHGYSVISARNGKEAIALYQQHQQDIDLVLTDMGLPLMTGRDEYLMLKKINPHVRVIIASGFFEPDVKTELAEEGVREFIQKPYRPEELLRMIRLVLDSAMHISNNHDSE
ncbi:MAG TPA: PAS domain S-box protein, partial [Bacteroidota bacterium]|nr:PAS domain S-box protein [Bacteroidota bacterium]